MGCSTLGVSRRLSEFTDQWLDTLREGDLNQAFLQSLQPDVREGLSPRSPEDMRRFERPRGPGKSDLQAIRGVHLSFYTPDAAPTAPPFKDRYEATINQTWGADDPKPPFDPQF